MKRNFTRIFGGMRSFILTTSLLMAGGGAALAAGQEYSVNPEPGEVESLRDIVVMWGQSMLTFGEGDVLLSVNGGPEEVVDTDFTPGQNFGYFSTPGNVTIQCRPEITEPGMYYFTIPEGYVTINQTGEPNEEIILAYEIVSSGDNPGEGGDNPGGGTIPTPTFTPANYATVESISKVSIDWGIEIEEGSLGQGWFSSVNLIKDGEYYSYPEEEEIVGTTVNLYFYPPITEAGNYEIQIPEDYVFFPTLGDDVANPELSIYYFIEGGNEEPSEGVKPTGISPESGSTIPELNTVTINWEQRYISLGEATATLSKDGGETQDITKMISVANGSPFGGAATATINFNGSFNEAGEYTITLPAGMFNLASTSMGVMESSAEIVLNYTVTGEEVEHPVPDYTATPENGATINELNRVQIQWGSSMLQENGGEITLKINDGEPIVVEECDVTPGSEGWGGWFPGTPGNLSLSFYPAYKEPGTYTITIPAGYVYVKDASTVNGEIVLTYTITGEEFKEPTLKADPADKSTVESLDMITLDWGTEIMEGDNMGAWVSMVTILKDGEAYYTSAVESEYVTYDDKVVIEIDPAITEPGTYSIIIPEDYVYFTEGDCGNSEFTLTYTVKESGEDPDQPVDPAPDVEYTVIPSAEEPVDALPEIVTILFGDRKETLNLIANSAATLQIGDEEPVEITENVIADYEEEGEGWDLEYLYFAAIDLSDYVEGAKGNCTITLPEGFFNIGGYTILGSLYGGEDSPEVVIVYIVDNTDAIKGITPEANGIYTVYNINGLPILKTANILDLNNLPKGIYIINGKKFILR